MAQLIVRSLDPDIVKALKVQAARHGRSAEAEHREILRIALRPDPTTIKDQILSIPEVGRDEDFERPEDFGRATEL